MFKIALAGNPNCGKTTLLNRMTGMRAHTGNWPGVTVEKRQGIAQTGFGRLLIVDLPGIYSLSAHSMEERITRDYLLDERPDLILNIIDASSLERSLYLSFQLMELGIPMVFALNMMDESRKAGIEPDAQRLASLTGIKAVGISAPGGGNLDALYSAIRYALLKKAVPEPVALSCGLGSALNEIYILLSRAGAGKQPFLAHYASRIFEGDFSAAQRLRLDARQTRLIREAAQKFGSESERSELLARERYRQARRIARECAPGSGVVGGNTLSRRIDRIATGRIAAFPVFIALMLIMLSAAFSGPGVMAGRVLEKLLFDVTAPAIKAVMASAGVSGWLISLVTDGILSGVGTVLVFLPQLAVLFAFLSLLEESGYMARAAFITDRLMRAAGLSGRSFIPALIGLGCTTHAVTAARALDSERDKRLTIMLLPFISCAARIPVYGLFAGAFFASHRQLVVFFLYMLGIAAAGVAGTILSRTLFKGSEAPFVMELPAYRLPSPLTVLSRVWERCSDFVTRAGSLILFMSIIMWFFKSVGTDLRPVSDAAQSLFARFGSALAPLLAPLGFGHWRAGVALLSGIVAKEAIVSSMSVLYDTSVSGLAAALRESFTPASALSFLCFCLFYMPCISAIAAIYHEMRSLKWTLATLMLHLCTAYAVSFIVYRLALLFM